MRSPDVSPVNFMKSDKTRVRQVADKIPRNAGRAAGGPWAGEAGREGIGKKVPASGLIWKGTKGRKEGRGRGAIDAGGREGGGRARTPGEGRGGGRGRERVGESC